MLILIKASAINVIKINVNFDKNKFHKHDDDIKVYFGRKICYKHDNDVHCLRNNLIISN